MEGTEDFESHVAKAGEFHGVYLLYCTNPQFKGRTYIGYTVNPSRRIKQHNGGVVKGGAWKTSGRGPWDMVLITHGFPNELFALRFEWAWQHPKRTRRLPYFQAKSRTETGFTFCIRVLSALLNVGPWNRLPLTIQWLKQEYVVHFPLNAQPPLHMAIAYGPITTQKKANETSEVDCLKQGSRTFCGLCNEMAEDGKDLVKCIDVSCTFQSCITCLAKAFLENDLGSSGCLIPIKGQCPCCGVEGVWRDFVLGKQGRLNEEPCPTCTTEYNEDTRPCCW